MTTSRVRGLNYESDFLHPSPFSSTSSAMSPSAGCLGPPSKDDSSCGNNSQQQADGASALALFNRYAGNGAKGLSNIYPPYQHGFGQQNSSPAPVGFGDNEFPSLSPQTMSNRASVLRIVPSIPAFGGSRGFAGLGTPSAYATLMKESPDQPGFQIDSEDFPALPQSLVASNKNGELPSATLDIDQKQDALVSGEAGTENQGASTLGVQTHTDGRITGIPAGMLNDQFGMAGLLTVIRAVSTEPSVTSLALGQDLTKLGIDLNTPEKNIYQTFSGPFADSPCRLQDIDCLVPPEYVTNAAIGDKLAAIKLNRYGEDLLFYLFYNFGAEVFQLAAAAELYNRDWRYHKEQRVWIARAPGVDPVEKTATYEKGTYYVFDPGCWRKVQRELHFDYTKLEARPMLPPQQQQAKHPMPGVGVSSGVHSS